MYSSSIHKETPRSFSSNRSRATSVGPYCPSQSQQSFVPSRQNRIAQNSYIPSSRPPIPHRPSTSYHNAAPVKIVYSSNSSDPHRSTYLPRSNSLSKLAYTSSSPLTSYRTFDHQSPNYSNYSNFGTNSNKYLSMPTQFYRIEPRKSDYHYLPDGISRLSTHSPTTCNYSNRYLEPSSSGKLWNVLFLLKSRDRDDG